jgi:hypothetical protein
VMERISVPMSRLLTEAFGLIMFQAPFRHTLSRPHRHHYHYRRRTRVRIDQPHTPSGCGTRLSRNRTDSPTGRTASRTRIQATNATHARLLPWNVSCKKTVGTFNSRIMRLLEPGRTPWPVAMSSI